MQDLNCPMIILDKLIEERRLSEAIAFFDKYIIGMEKLPSSFINAITLCAVLKVRLS